MRIKINNNFSDEEAMMKSMSMKKCSFVSYQGNSNKSKGHHSTIAIIAYICVSLYSIYMLHIIIEDYHNFGDILRKELLATDLGNGVCINSYEKVACNFLRKIKLEVSLDLSISLLGI